MTPKFHQMKSAHVALVVLLVLVLTPLTGFAFDSEIEQPSPTYADNDTTVYVMPGILVSAAKSGDPVPAKVKISTQLVQTHDIWNAADLGTLLPSTRAAVNSRGEHLFTVRGASERQVGVYLDGIPLTVPWDERVDLSLIPADAISTVEASRGVVSALDGPNAIAGTIRLRTPRVFRDDQPSTGLGFSGGTGNAFTANIFHNRNLAKWSTVSAVSWRQRDFYPVAKELNAAFSQSGKQRTNSDYQQGSFLFSANRSLGQGEVTLLMLGFNARKGVAPETHLSDKARFWRYPQQRRLLAGLGFNQALSDNWDLEAFVSYDLFSQEIHEFADGSYTFSEAAADTVFEKDNDRTGYLNLQLRRYLPSGASLALQSTSRITSHKESLVIGGPTERYSQNLNSWVGEVNLPLTSLLSLTAGVGYERSSTPTTGDKPVRPATDGMVYQTRLSQDLGQQTALDFSFSRRSRFPSLREMFSGALGRFVPNNELRGERQDLIEAGFVTNGSTFNLGFTAFTSWLDGGIEKEVLPGENKQFMRVNRSSIRTLGGELTFAWRPVAGWSLAAQYTLLNSRVKDGDNYSRSAEDRPEYLATVSVRWLGDSGISVQAESNLLGAREAADTTASSGHSRISAQATFSLRVAYSIKTPMPGVSFSELFIRADNLFDALTWAQIGLPESGRTLRAGVSARFAS